MNTSRESTQAVIDIEADKDFATKLDLFRDSATRVTSEILAQCPRRCLRRGEVLLEPGQANHHIYFLLNGQLDIRLKSPDSPVADTINVGDCIGEMSIIGAAPVVINAILDALAPFGVTHLEKPVTSEKIWRAISGIDAG